MLATLYKLVVVFYLTLAICSAKPSGRIVNGTNAAVGQFPYQALIFVDGELHCGGSIISSRYVLTAAHCALHGSDLKPHKPSQFVLRLGSIQRMAGGKLVGVEEVKPYPDYGDFIGDLALLKLNVTLTFTDRIKKIDLYDGEVPTGSPVVISGWGRLNYGGKNPQVLQYYTSRAIDTEECRKAGILNWGHEQVICLAHENGHGSCNGDSGGPATFNGKLVGASSFSTDGCGSAKPDGYAKVSYYREWILKNMI